MTSSRGRLTTEEFIKRARHVHGDIYDYSKVEYKSAHVKVCIIDPDYGEFWQTPHSHVKGGHGSPFRSRGGGNPHTLESFIAKSREVHGQLYDYSKVEFKGVKTKVCVVDPDYGEFWVTPDNHFQGKGNPERAKAEASKLKYTLQDIVLQAREVHGDLYDYSKAVYNGYHTKILIVDPEYGEFWQTPADHLSGRGNPTRGSISSGLGRRGNTEDFVTKAREVHGGLYDYSRVDYITNTTNVLIVDPTYGEFWQTPSNHLKGYGCPRRIRQVSYMEAVLTEWLNDLGIDYTTSDRTVLDGREIDILIPEYRLGIEVDGLYWHNSLFKDSKYHQGKVKDAFDNGINLLQFFETEIEGKLPIVQSMILSRMGKSPLRIFARNTKIKELTPGEYREFMEVNHIQGSINSRVKYGLEYRGELVSAIGLSTRRGVQTIDRFASKLGTQVVGGFTKLLKKLPRGIIRTHSANRYSTGEVYRRSGFRLVGNAPYTLYFTRRKDIYPREKFQTHKLPKLYQDYEGQDPTAFLESKGVYRFYAAGTKTWEITNS